MYILKSSVTFFRESKLTAAGFTEKFDTEFLTKNTGYFGLWKYAMEKKKKRETL